MVLFKMKEEVDRVIALYHSSNYVDFLKSANALLEKGIHSEFLYSALSNVYFLFDHYERALSLSQECQQLFPNINHLINQARIHGHMKKYDQQALILVMLFESTRDITYVNQLIECPFRTPCFFSHITKWYGEGLLNKKDFYNMYRIFLFKHSDIFLHQGRQLLSLFLQLILDRDTMDDTIVLDHIEKLDLSEQVFGILYLLLPKQCYRSDEIEAERTRLTSTLNRLLTLNLRTMPMSDYVKHFPHHFGYYYTYLGQNVLPLAQAYSALIYKLCPDLHAHATKTFPVREPGKIRVGFCSRLLFKNHSVCRDRMGIIRYLCNDPAFEVTLFTLEKEKNVLYSKIMNETVPHRIVYLSTDLNDNIERVSDLNLDILVYPELGMCSIAFLLAHARLAPVQLNTWGHSESCGIPTIDQYVSSALFETETSQQYYSERLWAMPSLSTYYYSLDLIDKPLRSPLLELRVKYKLSSVYRTYGVFQTVFKYHPDTLYIVRSLLERDPGAYIVMIADHTPDMRAHLEHHLGELTHRVRIIETMVKVEYCQYMQCMDLLIDTYPFGGCNTTLDAFYFDKVVMTLPSDKLNGRFTYGFYKKMGIDEPVCTSLDDLVTKSIQYARDVDARTALEHRIRDAKKHLFEEFASVIDWNAMVRTLCHAPALPYTPRLVVARYKEDVSFLDRYAYPATVYNKHEGDNLLPNVGREGHTYLHHIVQQYETLDDITVFVPASCYDNPRKRTLFHYVLYHAIVAGKTTYAGTRLPDLRENNKDFQLDHWEATEVVNRGISKLDPSPQRPYGAWYDTWFGGEPFPFVTFFGIMAVRKEDILSRPKAWYHSLLNRLVTPNPEEGHYVERSWGAVFQNKEAEVVPITAVTL